MRSVTGTKAPDKPADPIIVHPDIRRMLLISKSFTEGARGLAYWIGMELDIANTHPDPAKKQEAEDLVALMTPILKAYFTDMGTEVANLSIQIYGGHGYIWESGVEQYARDGRIAQIYEGANGIQALDLVGRKMAQSYGRLLRRFFHPVQKFIEDNAADEGAQEFIMHLAKAFAKLQQATGMIAQKGLKNADEAGAASSDYLRQFALVAMAYMWCRIVLVAQAKLKSGEGDKAFFEAKIKTARFFMERVLPEADARFKMVMAGAPSMMAMTEGEF
ncbi:MAG TPA: acyl-CoA dehydrogenase C-terminal domain-containing protein [Alphaproteobacteria bacterium]|nr:acyl-CoA dehydrogenase C-terminal domain-containing protein [Alphaproteobacteria bacterium]